MPPTGRFRRCLRLWRQPRRFRNVEYFTPQPVPAWQGEFAVRYWIAAAKTGKSLYDVPSESSAMVSRLTYDGLETNAGELDGRIAFTNGLFVKGYAAFGAMSHGQLQDEDFPPAVTPYSSTISDQHGGTLDYASADLGYDVVRGGDFRIGAFAGYHFLHQSMVAYGCTQQATNPDVCQPAAPATYNIITQNNDWQSVRLGLEAAVKFGDRVTLSADGAWLPYVFLNGANSHWARIAEGDFSGAVPEDGKGQGYQLEAVLSYRVTQYASLGIGGRYWHMQTSGSAHFEDVAVDGVPQPVDWKTDIYGVFLQGSIKIGPYPLTLHW